MKLTSDTRSGPGSEVMLQQRLEAVQPQNGVELLFTAQRLKSSDNKEKTT